MVGGIWTVFTDRVVEWGKAEEETRLIGRVEERYTGTEWLKVIFATIGLIIVVVLEVLITLTLILRLRNASLPPTGHRYWVQGHKYQVHIACFGNSSDSMPMVFVEGGEGSAEYFSSWVDEAQEEGLIGQYCYWDRPGYAIFCYALIVDLGTQIMRHHQCPPVQLLMLFLQLYQKQISQRKDHDGSLYLTVLAGYILESLHPATPRKSKVSSSSIQYQNP